MALATAAERGLLPDGRRLARIIGPQTDEELLDAVEALTGYHIPRVAVCTEHGHVAPSQTFCDMYFERVVNCLWIGNRGGGKTTNSGFLHGAKNHWHDNYSSALAGAVDRQGDRGYSEFKRFTRTLGDVVLKSLRKQTSFSNGSIMEVLGGTIRQLNGPHPHLAQFDELELAASLEVFQEFLNMAQGNMNYSAQQLLTSTRKRAHGMVQGIVREVQEALRIGEEPPWAIHIFCVFETMRNIPNCRTAPENADRPETELCNCHQVKKGTWDDGKERRLDQVCGGKAYRADGFVSLSDVQSRFRQLSRMTWEAQQECLRPSVEGIVHKWVNEKTYLRTWLPYAEFGRIFRGWDWGGQNPHALIWGQLLSVDVALVERESDGELVAMLDEDDPREIKRVIPAGTLVEFDEIYGNADVLGEFSTLGLRAVLREEQWRTFGFPMRIDRDFCDPAGMVGKREVKKACRLLLEAQAEGHFTTEQRELMNEYGIDPEEVTFSFDIPEFKSSPAPRYESIRKHIEWGEDGKILLVEPMCPATSDEYDVYHWEEPKPGKNLPEDAAKDDDHAMDAKRYMIWNIVMMEHRAPTGDTPGADARQKRVEPKQQSVFAAPQTVVGAADIDPADGLPGHLSQAPAAATGRRVRELGYPGVR